MPSALIQIGECFSGLFHPRDNSAYRRIYLMTPSALKAFRDNAALHQTVRGFDTREVLRAEIFRITGLKPELFLGRREHLTIGLRVALAKEKEIFDQAKRMLRSSYEGAHRSVFFRMMGIEAPKEIDDLSPSQYAALWVSLAKVDPTLESINAVRFDEGENHDPAAGEKPGTVTFSRTQLDAGTHMSRIDPEAFEARFITAD